MVRFRMIHLVADDGSIPFMAIFLHKTIKRETKDAGTF